MTRTAMETCRDGLPASRPLTDPLRSSREVRNAIAYVLHNWRKHMPATPGIDPCSSGAWFDGWKSERTPERTPIHVARTWLGSVGWRRHGLITITEYPKERFAFD